MCGALFGQPVITARSPFLVNRSLGRCPARRFGATVFSPVDNWLSKTALAYNHDFHGATSPHMRADLWQRGCERLASELPDQQFNTWIRPLPDADVADHGEAAVVTVRVPNRFKLDWIRHQYAGRIETVLSELAGKPVRLEVALAQRDGSGRGPESANGALPSAARRGPGVGSDGQRAADANG